MLISRPAAGLQSLHRAFIGDLLLPRWSWQMGGDREQRDVPTRDARADGLPERRACARLGSLTGTPDDDPVRHQQYQRPARAQGTAVYDREVQRDQILEERGNIRRLLSPPWDYIEGFRLFAWISKREECLVAVSQERKSKSLSKVRAIYKVYHERCESEVAKGTYMR